MFSGSPWKIRNYGYISVTLLWLVSPQRAYLRTHISFFNVFVLTWSVFIESLKVLLFSGIEKKMPEDVYNGVSPLWRSGRIYVHAWNILHGVMVQVACPCTVSSLGAGIDRQVYARTNHSYHLQGQRGQTSLKRGSRQRGCQAHSEFGRHN